MSPHTLDDLEAVGGRLRRARLFVRIDPLGTHTAAQLEQALARGAEVVMLPMFSTAEEVEAFIALLAGRAEPVLLLERREAVERIAEIAAVPGVGEIHVGINDLSLELGLPNRFAVFVSDEVERVAAATHAAGLRFGIGGLGSAHDTALPIASDLVYAQHARLGSTAALIARRFGHDGERLADAVRALRRRLAEWGASEPAELAVAQRELRRATASARVW